MSELKYSIELEVFWETAHHEPTKPVASPVTDEGPFCPCCGAQVGLDVLEEDGIAEGLFWTDQRIIELVDRLMEGREDPAHREFLFERAWDRNEFGARGEAEARAAAIMAVFR